MNGRLALILEYSDRVHSGLFVPCACVRYINCVIIQEASRTEHAPTEKKEADTFMWRDRGYLVLVMEPVYEQVEYMYRIWF